MRFFKIECFYWKQYLQNLDHIPYLFYLYIAKYQSGKIYYLKFTWDRDIQWMLVAAVVADDEESRIGGNFFRPFSKDLRNCQKSVLSNLNTRFFCASKQESTQPCWISWRVSMLLCAFVTLRNEQNCSFKVLYRRCCCWCFKYRHSVAIQIKVITLNLVSSES